MIRFVAHPEKPGVVIASADVEGLPSCEGQHAEREAILATLAAHGADVSQIDEESWLAACAPPAVPEDAPKVRRGR